MTLVFEESNFESKASFGQLFLHISDPEKQAEKAADARPNVLERASMLASGMSRGNSIVMTYDDFCDLAVYVLTNEDLHPNDVRLKFIERIKRHKIVKGWSPEQKRLAIPGRGAADIKVIVATEGDAHFAVFPYNLENMRALLKDAIKGNDYNTLEIDIDEAKRLVDDSGATIEEIHECLQDCMGRSAGLRLDVVSITEHYSTCSWWE